MRTPRFPILDDHIHIDPRNGRGIEAAKDFKRAGGTHMCLVTKPSWSLDVHPVHGAEFRTVFDETIQIAKQIADQTGLCVYPVLGVHPAEITVLSKRMSPEEAAVIMKDGLTLASEYVRDGRAIAIKSGRPHYDVPDDITALSNEVLIHAFTIAKEQSCAVQVHAESGPCSDMIPLARSVGLDPFYVVKHFATPDTPLTPSFIAKHEAIPELCRNSRYFTMESDYMDENSRPGAVIGPKSVPRFTLRLLEEGKIREDDVYRIHKETPDQVYGIEITL